MTTLEIVLLCCLIISIGGWVRSLILNQKMNDVIEIQKELVRQSQESILEIASKANKEIEQLKKQVKE